MSIDEKLEKDIEEYFKDRKKFDNYMQKANVFDEQMKNKYLVMLVTQNDFISKLLSYIILKLKDNDTNINQSH